MADEFLAGMVPAPPPALPKVSTLEIHVGDPGVIEEREVQGFRDDATTYRMIRTASGWQHADEGCPDWLYRPEKQAAEPCIHVKQLNEETK